MERAIHIERIAADVLHECPVLCEKLDGLARLATCSKALTKTIETVIVREGLGLLDAAWDTAQQIEQQQQHKQAATWLAVILLRKAPGLAVDVTERLLHLPSVPLDTAKQLVDAGVRITYAQLLAAARSMVAGVEVWVQAKQELGIQTDIPALAVTVCCDEDWVSGGGTDLRTVTGCSSKHLPAGLQPVGVQVLDTLANDLYTIVDMNRHAEVPSK
jgi:hypothetical protein